MSIRPPLTPPSAARLLKAAGLMTEPEAKAVLSAYGIPTVPDKGGRNAGKKRPSGGETLRAATLPLW